MSRPVAEIALDAIADVVEAAGRVLGVTPAGAILQVTGIALRTAEGVVHEVSAEEMERLARSARVDPVAGQTAWEASHQDFHKGEKKP